MPIPFDVWIDGVLGTASFLADRAKVEKVWLGGDKTITSITTFDEASEQLLGDLAATEYLEPYAHHVGVSEEQKKALIDFVQTFKKTDAMPLGKDVQALLASSAWHDLELSSQRLVLVFAGHPSIRA